MDWLTQLAQNSELPLLAAFALGVLTAISPCPLATNITATAYIAKNITSKWKVLLGGLLYTFGRMVSYTGLGTVIYLGISKFQVARLFQGNGEKFIGPVMIIIGLIMLDVINLNFFSKFSVMDRFAEHFRNKGMTGAFLLGLLFALAFCPYSGALFFAMLIPMTTSSAEGLALPVLFSIGTGLPVILFSFLIAYGANKLGIWFRSLQKIEKAMRIVAGITFLFTGLYYLNIFLKIL